VPVEQFRTQHPSNIREDVGSAGGMKPVTSVVDRQAAELETPGVAADRGAALEDGDLEGAAAGETIGRPEAGRASAENREMGTVRHTSSVELQMVSMAQTCSRVAIPAYPKRATFNEAAPRAH